MARTTPPTPHDVPCGSLGSPALLEALRPRATRHDVKRGEVLVRQGDPPDFLGIVLAGRVKVVKTSPDGRELIVHVVGPDKSFGIVPVLDGAPYPATVEAVEDATWGRVEAATFLEVLGQDAALALHVLRTFGGRLRRMADAMLQASTAHVANRLADRLLDLAGPGTEVQVTRQELADLAGTTVETAIRVTKAWEREGLVALSRGHITIRQREALALVAGR